MLTQFLSHALPDRADVMRWPRLDFLVSFFPILFILLLTLGLAIPSFSADLSDREEDGLLGNVLSVETRESLLVQTDRYDPVGRLIERIQGDGGSLGPIGQFQRNQRLRFGMGTGG